MLTLPDRALKIVARQTGIKVSCHALRRSFCTIAATAVVNGGELEIKAAMRYKITDVTWSAYMTVDIERVRALTQRVTDYILKKAK